MIAKDLFQKLGYLQTENSKDGIQYTNKSKESEMQRIGMINEKCVEFYPAHKEILFKNVIVFRDGSISISDSIILSFEEFNAVQKQILELNW